MPSPEKFKYRSSRKIINWGCNFDSLTELKYAISICEEYHFLRGYVVIYYHPGTRQPAEHTRDCHRRYSPDFLIRHKQTGEAFLVEIKPRAFQGQPQLDLRKQVAENYIHWKEFDWKYKVVFDDEIILTQEQLEDFQECMNLRSKAAYNTWFEQYNSKFERNSPSISTIVPSNTQVRFVMYGDIHQPNKWRR